MYDKLVKRLRSEAQEWCVNCCYKNGGFPCNAPEDRKSDCDIFSTLEAADAIEALERELMDLKMKTCGCFGNGWSESR